MGPTMPPINSLSSLIAAATHTLTLNVEERRVGIITLNYDNERNGLDVIGDHTDIPHINRLVEYTIREFAASAARAE